MKKSKTVSPKVTLEGAREAMVNSLIVALEKGTAPWVRPWRKLGAHRNGVTGHRYQGENVLLCMISAYENGFNSHQWLTFKQADVAGGQVRKGEKGTRLLMYKQIKKEVENKVTGDMEDRVIPLMSWFTVFNRDQIDRLPEEPVAEMDYSTFVNPFGEALLIANGVKLLEQGDRAFYRPSSDTITMPDRALFNINESSGDHWWSTLLHEVTHWSGHESRCNRDLSGEHGSAKYAFEELVAELGSAMLCQEAGVDGELRHANYLGSWLKVLKGDPQALTRAVQEAGRATNFLIENTQKKEQAA